MSFAFICQICLPPYGRDKPFSLGSLMSYVKLRKCVPGKGHDSLHLFLERQIGGVDHGCVVVLN